jgi:steroid delta-isomerase-like uncharacterized protein
MQENTIPELVDAVRNRKMSRRQLIKTLATMGISAAGISVIVGAASRPLNSQPTRPIDSHEDIQTHLQRHDQHITYQTQGNTRALHDDYAELAVVEDSMYDEPFVGRAAIMMRKNVVLTAASNPKIEVLSRVVQGNQVSVEWVATGVHTGDLPELPASGRPFSIRGVTVVIREDGKIVRESLYYDVAELRRQLNRI